MLEAISPFAIGFSFWASSPLGASSVPHAARYERAEKLSAPAAPRPSSRRRLISSLMIRSNCRSRSLTARSFLPFRRRGGGFSDHVDVLCGPGQPRPVARTRQATAGLLVGVRHEY